MPARKRARSSVTGRWVTLKYALLHPRETIVEAIKKLGD